MIKVERNIIQKENWRLKSLDNKYFQFIRSALKENTKEEFLNFSTYDFLGLNEKFNLEDIDYTKTNQNTSGAYSRTLELLQKVFNTKILIFPNEANVYQIALQKLVNSSDCIVLDELAKPNLKIAVKNLSNLGIPVRTINGSLSELEEVLLTWENQRGKIWFVSQSIYPIPGKYAPLQAIKTILKKYKQVCLFLDDSYSLGWFGSSGQGIVCSTFENMERVVMVASLTKSFGASGGAIIAQDINSNSFREEISPKDFLLHDLKHTLHNSELFLNREELKLRQMQLRSLTRYFQDLTKGHLPCVSDPSLPVCFFATQRPEISYDVCSDLLKKGIYVTSAVYPHSSIHQPGIKINITLKHSEKDIKILARTLKDVTRNIAKNH